MTQLAEPAAAPAILFEESPRWVRTIFAGQTVASSKRMMLRKEGWLPVYCFPREDVNMELLVPAETDAVDTTKGRETRWHVQVGDRIAENAAVSYEAFPGYVSFEWNAMDAWFEEDDEIYKHARDPYHRIDVLNSSRHVRVEIDGVTVAESGRPRVLFETGIPTRFYLPAADVRMEHLTPTDTHSVCPYKGTASYWSVTVNGTTYDDLVWGYPNPITECPKIEGLLCFYNEKVDLYLDGELQERPSSNWS
jgi:uncharacterized protein (DUF427 family)